MNVLFLCTENSCRSQIAEALARVKIGEKVHKFYSAGSQPSGVINANAIRLMGERGYALSQQFSKALKSLEHIQFDIVFLMGCGDHCPAIKAKFLIEWNIPDPKNMEDKEFNEVIDLIDSKIEDLNREFGD